MLSASVVVPLYNHGALAVECLRSVPPGVEVVVVDDASTDDAVEIVLAAFPGVSLLRNPYNLGFAATANRGLQACSGTVRVVLNSDARLTSGALESLVAVFDDARIGVAGPRLVFPDGSHQISAAAFPRPGSVLAGAFLVNEIYRAVRPGGRFPLALGMSRREHERDHDVDWVHGTCFAIRDQCLTDVAGFDEEYRFMVEEMDLCLRARRSGWRVRYCAAAVVEHAGGASASAEAWRARRYINGEARFMARAYGLKILPRWRMARATGALIKMVAFGLAATVSTRARARWSWQRAALGAVLGTEWRRGVGGDVVVTRW